MKYLKFLAAMFYMLAVFTACENDIETKMEDLENRIENLENGGSTMGGTNGSSASTGTENGHEYVDLGLSVKWATCNVGATRPEYFGNYYAWGETTPNTDYDWDNYKWCNGSSTTMTKYCTDSDYGTVDNKTVLDKEDDAAAVNMGGSWRMPTLEEWTELIDNCTWEITDSYKGTGVEGRILKSDI
ncbi:MAG: hypothetical protein J6Q47_00385, partial [Paludibacteraceae bacterium]|nr:hypothetical protein [Paludibacteraceae bacterium]